MRPSIPCLLLSSLWLTTPLVAQTPTGPGAAPPLTLSDADKAAVLSQNTESSVANARAGIESPPDRGVHGEIGAGVGSNGLRTVYGAAAIPLGDKASASVSFARSRFGHRP